MRALIEAKREEKESERVRAGGRARAGGRERARAFCAYHLCGKQKLSRALIALACARSSVKHVIWQFYQLSLRPVDLADRSLKSACARADDAKSRVATARLSHARARLFHARALDFFRLSHMFQFNSDEKYQKLET